MPDFPGIPWEALEEDITLKKSDPTLTLENISSASPFPQFNLKNPQRNWQLRNSEAGELLFFDVLANASRLIIDGDGKLSSISAIAQSLLPDADNFRSLGSSSLRWSDVRTALLNGWNPDAHASRHEYGGADPLSNLDYLAIRGTTIIDSARQLQNIEKIIQDITLSKSTPVFTIEETASGTWFPRLYLINPARTWLIYGATDQIFRITDGTANITRYEIPYDTSADAKQFRWRNSGGTEIMYIDMEGDLTITGKLTQSGCPEFSKMTLNEIQSFLIKCRDKEYHKTQEEVVALIHLVLNLAERVEQLERKLAG
jgi:hypothetical protein